MKKLLLAMSALLLLVSRNSHAQNLVLNADFEARNAVPSTYECNAGPAGSVPYAPFYLIDDLPGWDRMSVTQLNHDGPAYISTDGRDSKNFTYYGWSGAAPHSGISSVLVAQHDANADHQYDQFLVQQLSQALLPGHRYHVEFWALRPMPTTRFRTKLALSITTANPTFSDSQNSIVPSPGSKVVISGDIQPQAGWTLVSGNIDIPCNESTNQWVTIGYDRSNQYYDASLSDPAIYANSGGIGHLIDDVSLTDMGETLRYVEAALRLDNGAQKLCPYSTAYIKAVGHGFTAAPPYHWTVTDYRFGQANTTTFDTTDPEIQVVVTEEQTDIMVTVDDPCHPGQQIQYPGYRTLTPWRDPDGGFYCDSSTPYRTSSGGVVNGAKGEQLESASTTAYPNPATESLTIPKGMESATLLNDAGKPVQTVNKSGKLDVQSLPDGLYNLQMMQDGKLINQRIQVKH